MSFGELETSTTTKYFISLKFLILNPYVKFLLSDENYVACKPIIL